MNYNVLTFDRTGNPLRETVISAKTHAEAAFMARGAWVAHARVKGKTAVRFAYDNQGAREINAMPTIHRVYLQKKPALLLMFDKVPEFVVYSYNDTRNKAYMECTKLAYAESANLNPALIDTTVYSGAMFGSKSGSMLKKTLSGSATSVTCKDLLTPSSTGDYFGFGKSDGSAKKEWNSGLAPSPSRSGKTIFAKLNLGKDINEWPGINEDMSSKNGKVMKFTSKIGEGKAVYEDGDGWFYLPEWLVTRDILLKVSPDAPQPYRRIYNMVLPFTKCDCGCDTYHTGGRHFSVDNHYIDMQWLLIPERSDIDGQNMETGGKKGGRSARGAESAGDGPSKRLFARYIASYPFAGGKASGIVTSLGS